jgi:threonine efflux protein
MESTLATIWVLHFAAMLTPGANTLLVSQLAASGDSKGAAYAALGIGIGAFLWSSATVLGISAVFSAFPATRLALQVVGASYLLYVAVRLWRSGGPAAVPSLSLSASRGVRAGVMTNLSNPKSAVFFGSVFSAALPARADPALFLAVVPLVVLNALWRHLLLAYLFSRKSVQEGYAAKRGLFTRLAGALVGGLGLALLIASLRSAKA